MWDFIRHWILAVGKTMQSNVQSPMSLNQLTAFFKKKCSKTKKMKRYLYLVRHATAEDGSFYLPDFNRELTPEGIIEAARMGKRLSDTNLKPNFMISSSAARAYQTAKIMAEQLGYDIETIETSATLYDGGAKAYMAAITETDNNCLHLMVFGHNPDISFFAEYLTHADIGQMSKSGVVSIEFDNLDWAEVSARTGKLIGYNRPNQ
jgi:phosphohistidine phosphatase